jgi:hypothetical protein
MATSASHHTNPPLAEEDQGVLVKRGQGALYLTEDVLATEEAALAAHRPASDIRIKRLLGCGHNPLSIESNRTAFSMDSALHGPRRGFDTPCYSTDGA